MTEKSGTCEPQIHEGGTLKGNALMPENSGITEADMAFAQDVLGRITQFLDNRIVGQKDLKHSLIAALAADGHILLESVPGLAKTTAAKALADSISGLFSRIQCTPDLLPGDITGTQIYNQETRQFETIKGPVFANVVLLDEVNRSNAKTQSAMLEVMQERQVTIGGTTYRVPGDIFTVIATQNPIEQEGTYPLSEAQTDRFMIKEKLSYPSIDEEEAILNMMESAQKQEDTAVVSIADIDRIQDICDRVYMDHAIKAYIARIVDATRYPERALPKESAEYIRMGASPRASIAFMKIAKANALMNGRNYVIPEDVKKNRHLVLRHRIALNYSAAVDGIEVETLIDQIVSKIQTP